MLRCKLNLLQEKQKLVKQLEIAEEKGKDFKSKMTSFGAEKDRLFAEKMDTNNKLQQMLVNNEQLERVRHKGDNLTINEKGR